MYLFEAIYHVFKGDDFKSVSIPIEVDGQLFDSKKEIYEYAMGKAYDLTNEGIEFHSLTLIAC